MAPSRISIAAHTMSTPELEPAEAFQLYHAVGFDGIDLICAEDYRCAIRPDAGRAEALALRESAERLDLEIVNLTPYYRQINAADPGIRRRNVEGLKRSIELADRLGARSVRVWAGDEPSEDEWEAAFDRLVTSIREVGEIAAERGIALNVENHRDSMALTSAHTVRIIEAVDLPNVRILYDPANLIVDGERDVAAAFERQKAYIGYVHVKNVRSKVRYHHVPTLLDEGDVPWADVVERLIGSGYSGFVALEYEKRWHPKILPEPSVGLRSEIRVLRDYLARAGLGGAGLP